MNYPKPMPFKEALQASHVKTLLPTSMTSAQLDQLSVDVRERSRFSAQVRSALHLDAIDSGVNRLVAGDSDLATQRLAVKDFLRGTGYMPTPETRGGLQDFSSDARINLQLLTNAQQAQGYGWWKQGQDQVLLDAFPARKFVRVESRLVPRTDWPARWNAARAATTTDGATDSSTGVMAALVGHPIWVELNRFRTEWEPFDFGSGMGTEDMSRAKAIEAGLIERDTQIFPQERPFNADLKATPEVRSATVHALLEQSGVGHFDESGVYVYGPSDGSGGNS
jgi:hypothetical protein